MTVPGECLPARETLPAGILVYDPMACQRQNVEAYHTPIGTHYKYMEVIEAKDELIFRAFDLRIPANRILK